MDALLHETLEGKTIQTMGFWSRAVKLLDRAVQDAIRKASRFAVPGCSQARAREVIEDVLVLAIVQRRLKENAERLHIYYERHSEWTAMEKHMAELFAKAEIACDKFGMSEFKAQLQGHFTEVEQRS